jgi:hypothetical protein
MKKNKKHKKGNAKKEKKERIRKAVEDPDQSTSSPLVPMC